jgi:Leucine-rich repeat (LRR) protein
MEKKIKFEDHNLLVAICTFLNCSEEELEKKDLTTIDWLSISYEGIFSLSGIEVFTGLERLNVENNHIIDLGPLKALVNLKALCFDYNKVTDFSPLLSLPALHTLNWYNNPPDKETDKAREEVITILHDRGVFFYC